MIKNFFAALQRRNPFLLVVVVVLLVAGCTVRDKSIRSITIGEQVWMAENLATGRYRNGDQIRHAKSVEEWNDAISKQEGAWCDYGNDPADGHLYNWFAVADPRGLAPAGWHVPSDAEWRELEAATDDRGFEITFTGSRNCLGFFFGQGSTAFFWTGTPSGEFDAWDREISEGRRKLQRVSVAQGLGLSVRCVKDN
ncbi:MAG: fibrobacter succinogenes major paralogous domain-containing protein [Chlorobaculum sp.]